MTSKWRKTYKVHPAADIFPMMSDEELAKLGEDIKANGQAIPITVNEKGVLLAGRNRLEAMERAGLTFPPHTVVFGGLHGSETAYIISENIHRRHLTKQQQADLIVAVLKASDKPRQVGEVSKGGRGKVDKVKKAAVVTAKEHGIGKRTVERSFAKAEAKELGLPQPKPIAGPRLKTKPKLETYVGIDAARRHYLDRCRDPGVDLDAEQDLIVDALHEIAGRRVLQ